MNEVVLVNDCFLVIIRPKINTKDIREKIKGFLSKSSYSIIFSKKISYSFLKSNPMFFSFLNSSSFNMLPHIKIQTTCPEDLFVIRLILTTILTQKET